MQYPAPRAGGLVLRLLIAFAVAAPAAAQSSSPSPSPAAEPTGAVAGTVVSATNVPVAGVEVELVRLRRAVEVGADGAFRFDGLPPGRYLLHAEGAAGHGVAEADVVAGETAEVVLLLDLEVREEVVVTASVDPRSRLEVAQPAGVLTGDELDLRLDATLGETLDEQPGVSSTFFGPGASRPVIRGLGGDRVRMLQGGLGSADASNTSPDHAVSVEPLAAEKIEVLRGPATLLYGSSAVGGVVNVLDGRIPDRVPFDTFTGTAELVAGTVADEVSGGASVDGGAGRFAWHADFQARDAGDYDAGGGFGVVDNSAVETTSGALGGSWVGDDGFLGLSVSGFDTLYGVPGGHGHGHGDEGEHDEGEHDGGEEHEEEGEEIRIDLRQRRLDLRGERLVDLGPFQGLRLRLAAADYEHVELEGTEIGTRFLNDSWEGRFDLVQRPAGPLSGSLGLQLSRSDFEAIGEEAFVPPSVTDTLALFAFEEIAHGERTWQLGVRWESHDVDPAGALPERSFDGLSGSAGLVWAIDDELALTASLSRTERLPTANELFADGPHAATRAFEIGDPDLDPEVSTGLDVSLKGGRGRFEGELTAFVNRFDGFIYESFTGEQEDGLDVVRFVQRDAEFVGAELDGEVLLMEGDRGHLDLELRADWVRAELADGTPLPRIPPVRAGLGLNYHRDRWRGLVEVRRIAEQDDVAPGEQATGGYTMVNAMAAYRFLTERIVADVILRGTNLGDELARSHVSFLRDEAPLPGRNVSLILRLGF